MTTKIQAAGRMLPVPFLPFDELIPSNKELHFQYHQGRLYQVLADRHEPDSKKVSEYERLCPHENQVVRAYAELADEVKLPKQFDIFLLFSDNTHLAPSPCPMNSPKHSKVVRNFIKFCHLF